MRVFKTTYTDRKSGRQVKSSKWYLEFRDQNRILRRWPAFEKKSDTDNYARHLAELVRCRRAHESPDGALASWIDSLPADWRERLVALELLDARRLAAAKPLLDHLIGETPAGELLVTNPGFLHHLTSKGGTPQHARQTVNRIRTVFDRCGFVFWSDLLQPGAATRVSHELAQMRARRGQPAAPPPVDADGKRVKRKRGKVEAGISGKTFGYYVQAMKQFAGWMVEEHRATGDPFSGLRGVSDVDADSIERRPLSVGEMRWLVKTTDALKVRRKGLEARERTLVYRFAFETGVRPGQMRQLTPSRFQLDAEPPIVTSHAKTVKRRKTHVQVLLPGMVATLREHFKTKMPDAPAFKLPDKSNVSRMFHADMADARAAWIGEKGLSDQDREKRQRSDFLARVDHQGRVAVFYSLRHSHGTALGDAGVPQKEIGASLHHTRTATTDRYVHSHLDTRALALAALPPVASDVPAVATGTDGKPADSTRPDPSEHAGDDKQSDKQTGGPDRNFQIPRGNPGFCEPHHRTFNPWVRGSSPRELNEEGGFSRDIAGVASDPDPQRPTRTLPERQAERQAEPPYPPDLQAVIDAWPELAEDVRRTISGVANLSRQTPARRPRQPTPVNAGE
jgi:integrase